MVIIKYIRRVFLLSFFLVLLNEALATHIIGGDISYRCLGSGRYLVTLTVYSECGSQAVLESFYPINYYATDLSIQPESPLSFNVNKVSTQEVELFCNAATTDCEGGSLRGVERVTYQGLVDLGSHGVSSDWRFFWKRPARSEEITTLAVPEAEDFFIEASMNTSAEPCNNSVKFEGSPVSTVCINQSQTFNNVAVDPDGDELRYSLVTPKSNFDTEVVFTDDYNATGFMTFDAAPSLDAESGDLIFNPQALEVGITDFKIEEYRNGELIGWVKRGIQFTSIDCSNTLPVLSDFNGTNTDEISVCEGESLSLSLTASDADNDILTINLLEGPSDVFIVSGNNSTSPEGKIIWNTNHGDAGTYQFVVQASDNVCPQPGIATKTYTVEIRSTPIFDLGEDITLSCDETVILEPEITGGDGDYSFLWSDGSTSPSLEAEIGNYALTVTDGTGCSYTDNISLEGYMSADFSTLTLCMGTPVMFTDESVHGSADHQIVSWLWDFGDGSTSTEQNPEHTYATAGDYIVQLIITDNDDPACTSEVEKEITICTPPDFDFNTQGHCTHNRVDVELTAANFAACNSADSVIVDFGDGSSIICTTSATQQCDIISHTYEDPGTYDITVTVINPNGCDASVAHSLEVFPSPEVSIIPDDFFLVCSAPDSIINTEIVEGGTGAISYVWNTEETTDSIIIDSTGTYMVTATDGIGCQYTDVLTVVYPLEAEFQYDPYCKPGDTIQFHDTSVSNVNPITSYSWNFSDPDSGAKNTSTDQNPTHFFTAEGDYEVSLEVEDADGCQSSFSWPVYNTSIDNHFEVLPAEGELCLGSAMTGSGPTGAHIDRYVWRFGDGGSALTRVVSHHYGQSGEYDIDLRVNYNFNEQATSDCTTDFEDSMVAHPRPSVAIVSTDDRLCKDQEASFSFESDLDIESVEWTITHLSSGSSTVYTDASIAHTFLQRGDYHINVKVTDKNDCSDSDRLEKFVDRVVIPEFKFASVCAKEYLTFSEAFRDTLENITDYKWDFGDGSTEEGQVPIPMITHAYEKGGSYPVTLTVINSFSGCENAITKLVDIYAPPQIDFEADTICAHSTMHYKNLTVAGDGDIKSYQWVLPDNSVVETLDASYYFEGAGTYPVSLISTSSLDCRDTLTKNVYVNPIPRAGVEIPGFVEAFIPVQMFDDSEEDVISHFWDFGDGNTSDEQDPIHTYNEIDRYLLIHAVTNSAGCTDTLKMPLDLNVYLDLPTAFSPNNDNNNDRLRLIHQGIEVLYTYKLFNRYGQEVFDSGGNLNASWDGKYNDRDQAAGVYVAHVKAIGAYGKEFNFKKNVTLLR